MNASVRACSLQNQIHSKLIGRNEQERSSLQDRLQMMTNQNKALQAQLSEMKRKQAEWDCKVRRERRGKRADCSEETGRAVLTRRISLVWEDGVFSRIERRWKDSSAEEDRCDEGQM